MSEIVDLLAPDQPTNVAAASPDATPAPVRHRRSSRRGAAALAVVVLALGACSADGEDPVAEVTTDTVPETTSGERGPGGVRRIEATVSDAGTGSNPLCEPEPGKQVKDHEDVVIQETILPGVHQEEIELPDGRTMPEIDVPEFVIPAHTIDGGCSVTWDAPAGCLPRVAIAGTTIPKIEVPGYSFERLDGSSDRTKTTTIPPMVLDGVSTPDQFAEQTCAIADGAVTRESLQRPVLRRATSRRGIEFVHSGCSTDDGCPETLTIPSVMIPSVTVFSRSIDVESIEAESLGDSETQVLDDGDRTSYVAPAEVLFDSGKSDLKPAAGDSLTQILAELEDAPAGWDITVDGHTDDVGSDQDNQQLSERRAGAVADWLVSQGIDRSRITTTGFGETVPAASNDTDAGRAQNRRVVISVVR